MLRQQLTVQGVWQIEHLGEFHAKQIGYLRRECKGRGTDCRHLLQVLLPWRRFVRRAMSLLGSETASLNCLAKYVCVCMHACMSVC